MKTVIKKVISAICFWVIAFVLVAFAGRIVRPEEVNTDVWPNYYEEQKDSLSVLFFGSSAMYRYWIPPQAYEEQGFTSFLCSAAMQNIITTPELMEEALKTQDPDLIVVEVRNVSRKLTSGDFTTKDPIELYRVALAASGMRPSVERLNYINKYYQDNIVEKFRLAFPLLKYHDNVFTVWAKRLIRRVTDRKSKLKSTRQNAIVRPQPRPEFVLEDGVTYHEEALTYIDRVQEAADKLGVKVLFLSTPFAEPEENVVERGMQVVINNYIKEKGYDYIDLNEYVDEMEINFDTDFYNSHHTNVNGASKVTAFLGTYLKDNFELTYEQNEKVTKSWENAVEEWHKRKELLMRRWEHNVANPKNQITGLGDEVMQETELETEESA